MPLVLVIFYLGIRDTFEQIGQQIGVWFLNVSFDAMGNFDELVNLASLICYQPGKYSTRGVTSMLSMLSGCPNFTGTSIQLINSSQTAFF